MTEAGGRGAAFFDLDKTLIEGASGLHFARAAYRAGLVDRRRMAKDALEHLRYRVAGATDAQAAQVRQRAADTLAGVPAVTVARLIPDVMAGVLPAVYPQMLKEAWAHQDAGRPSYIVTAASQDLSDLLARVLTFDGGVGTPYELADGAFTGRLTGPFNYGEGKAEWIRRTASERGIDLDASYAYSDSASDLPMLRAVGHPVAVNPDAELLRVARAEGWRVMRFDKLGRRLKIAAGLAGLASAGLVGGFLAGRLGGDGKPRRRLRPG
jgi:HAD superfamily hydrolase (TIGR01490 family)